MTAARSAGSTPPHGPGAVPRLGRGSAPGTCGELLQGVTSGGAHVNVACPIPWSSRVTVSARPAAVTQVSGLRAGQEKMASAARRALDHLSLGPHALHLTRDSDLPVGRGLGSSTADIVATVRAVADAAGRTVSAPDLAAIAASIEPTDGTMFDGSQVVARDTGRIVRHLAWSPAWVIAMIVPPDTYDTAAADGAGRRALAAEYDRLLDALVIAADRRDARAMARIATRSAEMNQAFVVNAHHALLRSRLERTGAAGVVVGHTGTVAGLLFAPERDAGRWDPTARHAADSAARGLRSALPPEVQVAVVTSPGRQRQPVSVVASARDRRP